MARAEWSGSILLHPILLYQSSVSKLGNSHPTECGGVYVGSGSLECEFAATELTEPGGRVRLDALPFPVDLVPHRIARPADNSHGEAPLGGSCRNSGLQ